MPGATTPQATPYRIFSRDDLSGFWALLADNLANMVIVAALCMGVVGMPQEVVFGRILPGLGVALIFGLGAYAWMARRLAHREGRTDVTALPYGISTPVLFIFLFSVILPVRLATGDPLLAWQVGLGAAFVGGIIEALGSLVGPWLKRLTPRAGMLGTLAGIALVWIATVPMAEILEHPLVGLPALMVILVGLLARHRLPGGIPAGLAAILLGTAIFALGGNLRVESAGLGVHPPIPVLGDLWAGLVYLAVHPEILLVVAPMEIYNFIETMNNVESAEAAGDRYPVRACQLLDGGGTLIGALFGSPFPTTVYIGHPAYKRLGGRAGYALGVGIVLSLGAWLGVIGVLKSVIPVAAVAPLLVFVALAICAQAYSAVPSAHLPAVALAMIPHVADLVVNRMQGTWAAAARFVREGYSAADAALQALPDTLRALPPAVAERLTTLEGASTSKAFARALLDWKGIHLEGQSLLARGAILTGLLWGAIGALVIDGRFWTAALFSLGAALLTLFGFIHEAGIGLHPGGLFLGYLVWAALCGAMALTHRGAATKS